MGSSRFLWAILGVLLLAVVLVYGGQYLFYARPCTADQRAAAALDGGTTRDRQFAAVKLTEFGKPARAQILRVLDESKQTEVRVACIQGLTSQWDYRSMPRFLDLLDDPSPAVRLQAGDAVEYMLRKDFKFREVNGENQQAERRALIALMRARWEEFQKSPMFRAFIREKLGEDL